MGPTQPTLHTDMTAEQPIVQAIGVADLLDALRDGFEDFKAKRTDVVFLALIYPLIGLILIRITLGQSLVPLLFPLIAGFALVGPVAAIGFCELSRQRESGQTPSWRGVLNVFQQNAAADIIALAALHTAIFIGWLGSAWLIYRLTFGAYTPASAGAFLNDVFTTSSGWALIVFGNTVGLLFAVLVLCISAVSFPILLDREIGALGAIQTSLKVVAANPVTMAVWGLIVGTSLIVSFAVFLIGLAVTVPVLGHATWHLYRRAVAH